MGITIQQLSVFLENREGRLDEVLSVLAGNDVRVGNISPRLQLIVHNIQVLLAVAAHRGIIHLICAVLYRRAHRDAGRDLGKKIRIFIIEGVHIILVQGAGTQVGHIYIDPVDAHAGKAFDHIGHIAVDDADQDDHRANADDDPQHGKKGPHLIAPYAS